MRFRCCLCGSTCDATAEAWRCHYGPPFVLDYPAQRDVDAARRGPRGIWRWAGTAGDREYPLNAGAGMSWRARAECRSLTGAEYGYMVVVW